jgi:hypothetical protein
LGGWPSSEQVKQFLDVVAEAREPAVLVHCAPRAWSPHRHDGGGRNSSRS